ncbi:EamA family transporter [Thauera propionica]|uniref:EamA family transporter n=1 Tax=Thauera propionica TaxID=2019431 RepID=A0A235ETY9_9RHOO|nr:DMT family transporter [Thauera propionica]OYD52508.1 EamA family transporter [Thauera propionica]
MLAGLVAALGAGLLWGLVFLTPLLLGDYPGFMLAVGRYLAFGVLALGLAWFDRRALAQLDRADWIEAAKLALIGNLLYYATLASAIQLAGAPLPTLIIGTLPVVIAVCANLIDRRSGGEDAVRWSRLALPLVLILAGLLVVHGDSGKQPGAALPGGQSLGLVFAVLALACWTWYPIRNSRWLRARGPGLSRAWATAQGLATLPVAVLAGIGYAAWDAITPGHAFAWPLGPQPWLFVGMCVLLGLAASWLGTLLWNKASHLLPAALVGQLIVFETLAALLYAFIWYQRWPTPAEAAGIVLLVAGVSFGVHVFRGNEG